MRQAQQSCRRLGSRSGTPGDAPLRAAYRVERLGDGRFTGTGLFYLGSRFELVGGHAG